MEIIFLMGLSDAADPALIFHNDNEGVIRDEAAFDVYEATPASSIQITH